MTLQQRAVTVFCGFVLCYTHQLIFLQQLYAQDHKYLSMFLHFFFLLHQSIQLLVMK